MPGTPYTAITVTDWSDYVDLVRGELAPRCFRGQADAGWPIVSSLTRYLQRTGVRPDNWLYQEWRSLEKFQARAHHFMTHLPAPDDYLSWLALMQHHGAPTRLIDFTWSPYVAAFFALESAFGDAAVWALDGGRLRYQGVRRANGTKMQTRGKLDPRGPEAFSRYYLLENAFLARSRTAPERWDDLIWVGEPEPLNRRLISQSGTFAFPSAIDRPLEDVVATYRKSAEILTKVVLSAEVRDRALSDLDKMNINFATLFPGLDGLARSIGYMLETHWMYDPKSEDVWT
jgi:hypothetical protein